jgi:hypothetical protein
VERDGEIVFRPLRAIIAGAVFPMVFAPRLRMVFRIILGDEHPVDGICSLPVLRLLSGSVYRGMLQTELVRRWGALVGIVVSNSLYTFGPQHFYSFFSARSLAASQFASIFAIGLVFAMVFRRSGNLWLVGVMHAIGNSIIAGTFGAIR